jgi:hypothetical protein
MRECRTYGSVRGVPGDRHPYRDSLEYAPSRRITETSGHKKTHHLVIGVFVGTKEQINGMQGLMLMGSKLILGILSPNMKPPLSTTKRQSFITASLQS